ncbi:MAG TPA: VWA domain-containing protein [Burkholderiales bacterium]
MTFLWPHNLWFFLALPLLAGAYVWVLRRKKKAALRYAGLSIVKEAMGPGQRIRRHIPPFLFLLAIAAMIAAVARPAAVITLPSQHETVILAMDVSGSMRAEDVEPNRLAAAQAAARSFVKDQPRGTRIGVVAFAGAAQVTQPPTINRDEALAAIDGLQLQQATAIGSGILVSLKALFPDAQFDLQSSHSRRMVSTDRNATTGSSSAPAQDAKPVRPGSYTSAAIILLTDGQSTTGPNPIEAARLAAERGVRVFTVGVGTANGQIVRGEGWSMRVGLDEESLKTIADLTRGEYFYAGNALDLKKIYQKLNSKLVLEKKETEVTALFSAVAAVLAIASALLSLLWFSRIL